MTGDDLNFMFVQNYYIFFFYCFFVNFSVFFNKKKILGFPYRIENNPSPPVTRHLYAILCVSFLLFITIYGKENKNKILKKRRKRVTGWVTG